MIKLDSSAIPLPLSKEISNNVAGICNAIAHNADVNKLLFQKSPGTGKTEAARQIARVRETRTLLC